MRPRSHNAESSIPRDRRKRRKSNGKPEKFVQVQPSSFALTLIFHIQDSVAKKAAVQSEILNTIKAFYCELCEKQFQNVAQYDEHTNSYAHHHKARFRDMQAAQRASRNTQEELDKRKEKERKREEKELRKLAKAAGIKIAKPPVPLATPTLDNEATNSDSTEAQAKSSGFKKSGWTTIGQTSTSADVPAGTAPPSERRSGWAAVGPASSPLLTAAPAEPPATTRAVNPGSTAAPSFRTGGWASLDTGSLTPAPRPPAPAAPSSNSPPATPAAPPLAPVQPPPPMPALSSQTAGPPRMQDTREEPNASDSPRGWKTNTFAPSGVSSTGFPPASRSTPSQSLQKGSPAPVQEASRSGWQNFKAGASSRRR